MGGCGEGQESGWVDLDLRCSQGWWAAIVATYCPSRMVEHLKSKSTQPNSETTRITLYTFCRAGAESGGGVLQLPAGAARRGELRGHRHHRRDVLARHAARQGLPLHVREPRRLRPEARVSSSFCPSGTLTLMFHSEVVTL